jgi:hypothetical protein
MKIVPLRKEHMEELGGEIPPHSVRGRTVLNDADQVIGCAGGYHAGGHVMAFLHATDELRDHPFTMVRLAKSLQSLPHKTVFAYCDRSIEGAQKFLEHFGFSDRGDGIYMLRKP